MVLLTGAVLDDDGCAREAAAVAMAGTEAWVLTAFSVVEAAASWGARPAISPRHDTSLFPTLLQAVIDGDRDRVRDVLAETVSTVDTDARSAALVHLAYQVRAVVPDLRERLAERGALLASDADAVLDAEVGRGPLPGS